MPTYSPEDLRGAGTVAGSFGTGGGGVRTFTFSNPSGSAYFFLESITGKNPDGSINIGTTDYTAGTFSEGLLSLPLPEIVKNNYKFGAVIPSGNSEFRFDPTDKSRSGQIRFRGTGNFTLTQS